ncbi:DM13 domain-containing protein [Algoriphagus sp. D3-2-R+10]|uniref:DM13 domain-containing protein n=1 Tax=Algoriphagus aurantiacus TaxID=3103948 RepID=UPI002B3EEAC0|nr:DM13 domain-containing protein [Algoriphagus sp. D3-2-R+10]MEB2775164.1 DM13 domain-containing protein [Algoriphagus sp. D3-2-R+10]
MKKVFILFYIAFLGLVSCSEDNDPITIDPTRPTGTLNVARSGSFVDQNAAGSMGTAALGLDSQGKEFLQFSTDFNTALATGTVTVYLSTSDTFMPDPGNGNPNLLLVGPVRMAGENFFAIPAGISTANYTHVLLWCGSVGIPFGNAPLQ